MKATKLIINWEEQSLTSESWSAWVCYIKKSPSGEEYSITQWELKEDALVLIDASPLLTDEIIIDWNTIEIIGYNNNDGWRIDWWTTPTTE